MIVVDNRRTIIITPPHTGSNAMHHAAFAAGATWVVGAKFQGDKAWDHHVCRIPADTDDVTLCLLSGRIAAIMPNDAMMAFRKDEDDARCINVRWGRYRRILVWRHPERRLCGLWRHYNRWRMRLGQGERDFDWFVSRVAEQHPDLPWFAKTNITKAVGYFRIDKVITYGNLSGAFEKATGIRIPRRPTKEPPPIVEDKHRKLLGKWLEEDMNWLDGV